MEGYLKKYVNVVVRWQERYFILNDHILYYCERKGGNMKGQIHLKVSSIILVPEDPLRIIINTGTNEIHLRASNVAEKIEWVKALKKAQDESLATPIRTIDHFKKIHETLVELWMYQAAFEETLNILLPRLERQSNLHDLTVKLQEQAQNIKMNATLCTGMLEEEKVKLEAMIRDDDFDEDNGTVFQSFREQRNSEIFNTSDIGTPIKENQLLSIEQIIEPLKHDQPIKYKNLINNPIFKKLKFTNSKYRTKLPRQQDPNESIKIWSLIKDLIGKDLSRFSVPSNCFVKSIFLVYFNEPLSMLQRLAENLEYYQQLITANQCSDQWLRMCYVMGFGVSAYASNINRHKKPFNPILGETFEIQNKNFRFLSEQVSHHPPISAGYAEGSDFEFWLQTDLKTKLSPKCMEVQPMGQMHVILKAYNDHITYTKCTTKVNNIIFGTMYIDHIGDMVYTNHATQDTGVLSLLGNHRMQGVVKDCNGKEKYTLRGLWNDSLIAQSVQTSQEIIVWKKYDLPVDSKMYFHFTNFALNLNHVNIENIKKLPATDCRLRPDQIALEYGFLEMAEEEKRRLEQKQRERRKELAVNGQVHEPLYFVQQKDSLTNEMLFKYKGNYWNRQGEGLDLF